MGQLFSEVGIVHYLLVSAILFVLGLAVVMTRRNAIAVLMGLEMILNAAGINFVAFNRYSVGGAALDGQVFALFIIIIAAAEAAAALAIILNLYHQLNSVNVDDADALKQ